VYADWALRPWFDALMTSVPGLALFDAHAHTGASDPDEFTCSLAELTEALELAGARAVIFTMHEPTGYPQANDRVLAEADASDGRLVAFRRLDPHEGPVAEAERCLERAPAGSSSIRALRASRYPTSGSRASSRSPTSASCRS
jgi:uncharacterized protein